MAGAHDDDPDPLKHAADCNAVGHEVVLYPVRMGRDELRFDGAEMALPPRWLQRGWALKRNGQRWYRVKWLCRGCIVLEEAALERRLDYEKACKRARGEDETTYAQMLAMQ
jgi:hypothetical protein